MGIQSSQMRRNSTSGRRPSISEFLHVEDVCPCKSELLLLKKSHTIEEALNLLSTYLTVSAPVVNKSPKEIFLVSVIEILDFIHQHKQTDAETLLKTPLSVVMEWKPERIHATIAHKGESLSEVLRRMCKSHCYQTLMLDENEKICGILSQNSLVEFIDLHLSSLHQQPNLSIDKLDIGSKIGKGEVITCKKEDTVLDVISKMAQKNISALPMVDNEGKMLNTFSVHCLKSFDPNKYNDLFCSVEEFMESKHIHSKEICAKDIPFQELINMLALKRWTRCFVLDDQERPIGVITPSDILHEICLNICEAP